MQDEPRVIHLDPTKQPVLEIALSGDTETRPEAARPVERAPLRTEGVGRVGIVGLPDPELRVLVDPAAARAHGVTLLDVVGTIERRNVSDTGGVLESADERRQVVMWSRFEDPFEDEFGDEEDMEIVDESSTTANPNGMETTTSNPPAADVTPNSTPQKQAWMPGQTLSENETLEYDQSAYTMYHALRPEWPCLSFDILKDGLGINRSRFPHTMFAVAGTQADENNKNKLTVMKLDSLSKTYRKTDSDSEDDMSDSDSESGSDSEGLLPKLTGL